MPVDTTSKDDSYERQECDVYWYPERSDIHRNIRQKILFKIQQTR